MKKVNLLDQMTPEHLVKVQKREAEREEQRSKMITPEWLGLSELGVYYGWGAIQAVIDDKITLEQADMLINGARKIHSGHVFDNAIASLAANVSKKETFYKLLKSYTDDMKAVA
jgi:hypothetical protein